MNKSNKILKEEVICWIAGVAMFLGLGAVFGSGIYNRNVFDNRMASHAPYNAKHNRWHTDEMAAEVKTLQDSTLSANFWHYRGLSRCFTGAVLDYEINKKRPHDLTIPENTEGIALNFLWGYIKKTDQWQYSGILSMKNDEILDSLDNCVKKLDMRYDYLMKQRKSNQR